MRVWIDIDNPPQTQYLAPFVAAFGQHAAEVLVTARDNGITHELLHNADVSFRPVGHAFGSSRVRKVAGALTRTVVLAKRIKRAGGASLLLASSRSSALAARALGIPAFIVCDYEHVELGSYRRAGASLVYPDVIDRRLFLDMGFSSERLLPFHGLKEDITFAGVTLSGPPPPELEMRDGLVRVLVRPPAEDSHYFTERSRVLLHDVLGLLARQADVRMVLVPRHPSQATYVQRHNWLNEPIVLRRAVPTVSLLRAVKWVICSGGTMLREAAYLGIPAIGTFQGEIGCVDQHLAQLGAVRLVARAADLSDVDWRATPEGQTVPHRPWVVEQIIADVLQRVRTLRRLGIRQVGHV